jgi:hypothetical protein
MASLEYYHVNPGAEGQMYGRLEKIVNEGRLPFRIKWIVRENGETETRLYPTEEFAGVSDFVATMSLGHSYVDGQLIVSRNSEGDEHQSEKVFGLPGQNSDNWRVDAANNCLISSGNPLHQWMQTDLLFADLPKFIIEGTMDLWNLKGEVEIGQVVDEESGDRYSVNGKLRHEIHMSHEVITREGVIEYFANKYPRAKING